ncbi:MAG: alternative ribosome rescue aminoacyl-tRNA hydrolase ArfB [Actinomycetes bacterium]
MEDHVSPHGIVVPASAVRIQFARSGGPGGQHVNTSSSKVQLTIDLDACDIPEAARRRLTESVGPTLTVVSEESRSQWRNRHLAMARALSILDRAMVAPTRRVKTKPTRSAQRRRVDAKVRRGQLKAQRRWDEKD